MTLQDKLQASVKALDELSNNKRLAVTTRLAILEASDNIVAANEAIEELVEALNALLAVKAYYIDANPTRLTEAQVCDMVCGALAKHAVEQS